MLGNKILFLHGASGVLASDQPPHPHHYITVTSLWKGSRALRLPAILSTCSAPEYLLGVNLDMGDKRCQVMKSTNKMQWVGFKFCFLFGSIALLCKNYYKI